MALEPEDRAPRPGTRRSRVVVAVLAIVASSPAGSTAGYAVDDGPSEAEVAAVGGMARAQTARWPATTRWEAFGESTSATTLEAADSMSSDSSMPLRAAGAHPPVPAHDRGRVVAPPRSHRPDDGDASMRRRRVVPAPECIPTSPGSRSRSWARWDVTQGGRSLYELRDGEPARVLGTHWRGTRATARSGWSCAQLRASSWYGSRSTAASTRWRPSTASPRWRCPTRCRPRALPALAGGRPARDRAGRCGQRTPTESM